MTYEEWSNNKKKKKKATSYEEWSNSRNPVSAEQEREDAKKREAYLSSRKDIAPVRDTLTIETTQDIYDKYGKYFYESDFAELSKPTGSKIKDVGWKFWEDKGDDVYDYINDIDRYRLSYSAATNSGLPSEELQPLESYENYEDYFKELDSLNIANNPAYQFHAPNYGIININYEDDYTKYSHMTDFEVAVYNYLYASKGKNAAQEFLDDLTPAITYRQGATAAEEIQNMDSGVYKTLMYTMGSLGGGLESGLISLKQIFSDEELPVSSSEITNALLLEDLDGWKKNLYSAGNVIGNMAPSIAANSVLPGSGFITQGAVAGGSAKRQKLGEGYSNAEATTYGVIMGALEAATSKALSGIAGMTGNIPKNAMSKVSTFSPLSNAAAKVGTSQALSKVAAFGDGLLRAGAKYGINLATEITEEEIQLWLEPTVETLLLGEEFDAPTLDEMAETAIVTGISTGILNSSTDIATGQLTKVNGLSVNEAKVIEAEVKNRVAEAEADGKKLTGKEKEKIHDAVVEEAQRGYISTDTIESVLGGKSYENYKNLAEQKPSLESRKTEIEDEIKELVKTPELQFTVEQRERYNSLREEARGIKEQIKGIETAKTNLFNEVDKLTSKDTLLRESYNDIIRKTQNIDIDENQYNGTKFADAAKKTIENARKANANNSNRVRDFVEFSAKYSSQSGVIVDFKNANQIKQILENQLKSDIAKETDEAKLAELQDTLKQVQEGKIKVNGVKTKDGVAINLESPNYLNAVLGHGVTHFLENTDAYKALQNAVFKYAQTKKDYDGRRKIVEILYKNVEGTTVDQELTADLIGDYLFTEYDFIKSLSTENRNVFQKVYDKIKHMFKLATAGSKEARELEKLMHQFEKALRESAETSQNAEHNEAATQFSFSSIANTFHGDPDMPSMAFEKTDYKQTDGYKNYVEQCINNMRQTRTDFDESVARREIEEQIDGIVRVALAAKKAGYDIYDDATKRSKKDSKKRLLFSSLEPNSDYFTSSDISTECDKRKNFADIYDAIVRKEEAMGVPQGKRFFDNVDNYFYLHKVLADKGLTQPCRECYVESMRKNLAPMANAFLRLVNETDVNNKANDQLYHQDGKLKSNNSKLRNKVLKAFEANPEYNMTASDLTVEMLTTADGLAQLKIQAPLIYEAFNSFYGQSKPKMPKAATPFRFGELTALLTDHNGKINRKLVERINSTGGFRLQSYSDFQIENFTDVLQVICEAGTLGLSGHAYTKVPAFLKATEGTNLKRNISIFMYKDGDEWKLDKNDSFPYELEEIYDIVNSDASGNTGIIAVSQNKDMSCWIMANDFIGYGIPFHKSGLKMDTVRDTDVQTDDGRIVKGYSETIDHTKQQTEVYADTETKVKKGINIYSFWDFNNVDNLSKNELIEKNVREYIKRCEIAGYLPKFRDYVINNDSVLNDVLRYAKELGFVEQTATIDDISFKYEGKYHSYTIPYGYYKFLGDFNMFKPDGTASPHDTLSLNGYDFDAAERFFADAEGLRRNEILQQFANGEERQKYRDSDMDAEELTKIVKQKREEVVDSIVAPTEVQYSLSQEGEQRKLGGSYRFDGKDFTVKSDISPVREDIAENATTTTAETDTNVGSNEVTEGVVLDGYPTSYAYDMYSSEEKTIAWVRHINPSLYAAYMAELDNGEAHQPLVNSVLNISDSVRQEIITPMQAAQLLSDVYNNRGIDGVTNVGYIRDVEQYSWYLEYAKGDTTKTATPYADYTPTAEDVTVEEAATTANEQPQAQSKTPITNAPVVDTKSMYVDAPTKNPKKANWLNTFRTHFLDDASVFEDLAKETKNPELEAKFHFTKLANARAQSLIGKGKKDRGIKSLTSIQEAVKKNGKEADFEDYMYHLLNIDRMSMNERFGTKDVPVFDRAITADISRQKVRQYQKENPEFKKLASEIYNYVRYLRQLMVDAGLISQETADLWQEQTPHYIPIKRAGFDDGFDKMPNSGKKIKTDSVVKKVMGGNQPMVHVLSVLAERTERVYNAIAKNRFGVELKNTLNSVIESETATQEEIDNGIDRYEELLQKGKDGKNPTFTVFENGKKVTFEINNDMYEALKPTDPMWQGTNKVLGGLNEFRRGVLTEYSAPFIVTNAIKDAQDVLMNSKHPMQTYAAMPRAVDQLIHRTGFAAEYLENGGDGITFFDKDSGKIGEKKDNWLKKNTLGRISQANNFIEKIPRLAEYIASRENGASIEVAMLDAARVTTNFQAGGDITKFANRNGFTFLNASVQGALQAVRNVREAKMNGLKGWAQLAAKTMVMGLPALLLNSLMWGDDEEYEELSDHVKDNYYIVAKYGDGKFVRIPKGRAAAVIQNAFDQMGDLITGNDEVDLGRFTELVINNLAPANPLENNVIAPIGQAIGNKTWYGDDLVPTRLQDLPNEEQYDETTDSISKWLGENIGWSPYKWNYVIDQYSGGIGDVFLPMLTPEAERGDKSLIAPILDKFTTDSVMKNQNVSDFYTKKDELTIAANGSGATDEDVLKSKYMNSVNTELSDLYKAKREIQNSDLSNSDKYAQARSIQEQINNLAKDALNSYERVNVQGGYATVGDKHYRLDDGVWTKISDRQLERQQEASDELGVSPSEYWSNKDEFDFATTNPEKYEFFNANGISYSDYANADEKGKQAYTWAYNNPKKYKVSQVVSDDVITYRQYTSAINEFKGDDRKSKVIEYINGLDLDYGQKAILFKTEYKADDTYNYDIIDYLNNRGDLSYEDRVTILRELGFRVTSNGAIYAE